MNTPCFVVLHNPPHGLGKEIVEVYLEAKGIKINAIDEDDEGSAITVELDDPAGK